MFEDKEQARAAQRKSVEKRRENSDRIAALTSILKEELNKPFSKDGHLSKAEFLIIKMLQDMATNRIRPQDIESLQKILGEYQQQVLVKSDNPAERLAEAIKEARG